MSDIIKIVKSLEDSGILLTEVTETVQNEAKKKKGGFPRMLLGTLGACFLGSILAGKGINRAGEGVVRADYGRCSLNSSKSKKDQKNNEMDF